MMTRDGRDHRRHGGGDAARDRGRAMSEVKALGTHWVRMFLTWPDLQPARGVWAQNWVGYYEQAFSALPAGTKVILDVVGYYTSGAT